MKNLFTILFSFLISIYSIGCDSSNSSTNSSDCPFLNQSRGCDGVCSINPLTYDACGVCGGSAVLSGCDNTCGSTLENDACGVCGGEITNESDCLQIQCNLDVCISIQNVDLSTNILEVWMMNNIPVAGFQFNISGVTIISASEGSAQSNGMTQSNSEHIILGFSLSGNSIPSGNSILTHIGFSEYNGSICLSDPVFSNNSGEALSVELGDCFN